MALYARTIISSSPTTLLQQLSFHVKQFADSPIIYSISPAPGLPPKALSKIVSSFTSLHDAVGCLSAPFVLPSAIQKPSLHSSGVTSCSFVVFDPSRAVTFRSTLPGKETAQVGRWHAGRKASQPPRTDVIDPDVSSDIWEQLKSRSHELPLELQNSSSVFDTVLYISDGAPEGISQALSTLRSATKLGFLATSTPFITGRPFTLFRNSAVYSSGAVGISLHAPEVPKVDIQLPALTALTPASKVTSSGGNLIHTIDNSNPSAMLLRAISEHELMKGKAFNVEFRTSHFYVGEVSGSANDIKPHRIYRITSGDPGRGTISLEGNEAPAVGSLVQMFYVETNDPSRPRPVIASANDTISLNFFTVPSETEEVYEAPASFDADRILRVSEDCIVIRDAFLAASEHACIVSRLDHSGESAETPWKMALPEAHVRLHW
ncbi:hypothetical protein K474DRAFT_1660659 [Panus rudis PR-1116 ss-1]|nr:hypothetical protein K474DRAFT_1660659 [Panus rudis PR-1116 ss-1]